MDELTLLKHDVRKRVRGEMRALAPARRAQEEEIVQAAIQAEPAWQSARTVLLYKAVAPEFSVVGLTLAAWREGKRTLFPRVAGPEALTVHAVSAWRDLELGSFGIPEPRADVPAIDPEEVDLAIVPAVAWGPEGRRLGRGGGYYDRFLPRLEGRAWGVGFDCQVVPELPQAPHDARVARVWHAAAITGA